MILELFATTFLAFQRPQVEMEVAPPVPTIAVEEPFTVEGYIATVFGEDAKIALSVAKAESGLRPDVVNYLNCVGIFQIRALPNRPSIEELKDPRTNIDFAKQLFDREGWYPWEAYTNKSYRRYLQ